MQLNVTSKDRYWFQNALQFLANPTVILWDGYIVDPKGVNIEFQTERLVDVSGAAFDPLGGYRVDLNMSKDGQRVIRELLIYDGAGKVLFQSPQRELGINLNSDLTDASLTIVGYGNRSYSTFRRGDFDIEVFLHDATDLLHPLDDLVCDGRNTLQGYNLPVPMVCGRYPTQTAENANLVYDLDASRPLTTSAFLKAHPPR